MLVSDQRAWALDTENLGFLINGPLMTLLPGFLDAGVLLGFSVFKSLSAPTRAWVPNGTCFPASAKGQRLGSALRTRAGTGTRTFVRKDRVQV